MSKHFNAGRRHENSRLRQAVRQALRDFDGRLTTADAAQVAYRHIFEAGKPLNKCAYNYLRKTLKEYAVPIARTDEHPGRPWLWQERQ
jgi:hypothetical protein